MGAGEGLSLGKEEVNVKNRFGGSSDSRRQVWRNTGKKSDKYRTRKLRVNIRQRRKIKAALSVWR